jgi:hypothetical protein
MQQADTWILAFVVALCACGGSGNGGDADGGADGDTDSDADGDSDSDGDGDAEEPEGLFDPDHVVEVDLEIAPEDWDLIRHEGRGLASLFSGCKDDDFAYTYVPATATIDGETFENVGVRKKGYLGSLSVLRPSLKLNFRTFVPDQTYSGVRRMTLNNDRQDPSHTHQVMSYAMFREAGAVAPRANLARVTVNGRELGFYTHVEPVKKPFLARNFGSDEGNLYEGQGADFVAAQVDEFQRKTNEGDGATPPDRSDLDRVVEALDVPDSELRGSLEQVIDFDAFLTFWAMEVITGHWDGYTGDRNNFYVYNDPTTGLFTFIPWGTDGAFSDEHAFLPDCPASVYALGALAYRLYEYPGTRKLYHARLEELLGAVWKQKALAAEVDRVGVLTDAPEEWLDAQHAYLATRKDAILAELEGEPPIWPYPMYDEESECTEPATISGSFDAIWRDGADDYGTSADVSLDVTLLGDEQQFTAVLNRAGFGEDNEERTHATIAFYAPRVDDDPLYVILFMPVELVKKAELPLHGLETFGMVFELVEGSEDPWMMGYIGDGAITFDEVGTTDGAAVRGSFAAFLSQ